MGSKEWQPCTQNQRNKMTQINLNKPTNKPTEPKQQPTESKLPATKINKDKCQINQECQMLQWELSYSLPQARIHWGDNESSQVRTQPTRGSKDDWTKPRTSNNQPRQ